MDCVEGRAGESPALLTLSFPPLALQLVMLLTRKDRDNVADARVCLVKPAFRKCADLGINPIDLFN